MAGKQISFMSVLEQLAAEDAAAEAESAAAVRSLGRPTQQPPPKPTQLAPVAVVTRSSPQPTLQPKAAAATSTSTAALSPNSGTRPGEPGASGPPSKRLQCDPSSAATSAAVSSPAASSESPAAAALEPPAPTDQQGRLGGKILLGPFEEDDEENRGLPRALDNDEYDFYGRPMMPTAPPPEQPKKLYRCGLRTFLGQRCEKGVKVLKWLDDGESSQNTY